MSLSAIYQSALDRVHVFVIGSDGHLYDNVWAGTNERPIFVA
jgi:hypothetical protein